jgi:hypothetical protein
MNTTWARIQQRLGPGLHWSMSQAHIQKAIDTAESLKLPAVSEHLRIILARRNRVLFETPHRPE